MKVKVSLTLLMLIVLVLSEDAPLRKTNPELTAGYIEGDILPDVQRNGIRKTSLRWPNKTVYYRISTHFDAKHRNHILQTMRQIEAVSCVRFKRARVTRKAYVQITGQSGGCYANAGFLNRVQNMNLQISPIGEDCFQMGAIMHELLHVLGFFHMQSTYNRDDYVRIIWENINPKYKSNFRKYSIKKSKDFGVGYDYHSVMHYPPHAFSINGKMTIIPLKDDKAVDYMGRFNGLSGKDIKKLNLMYKCLQGG